MRLELFYPVKGKQTQPFGVNGAYYQANGVNIKAHNGIDFQTPHGTPIYASHDGEAFYEYDGKQGEGVVLRTNQVYDYAGIDGYSQVYFKTIYWHMCNPRLSPQFASPIYKAVGYQPDQTGVSNVGIPVKCGDLLGYADNTGLSTGDHLHFGLKPVMPGESNGTWFNLEPNNGYMGAINPAPFFNGEYAQDYKADLSVVQAVHKILDETPSDLVKTSWFQDFIQKVVSYLNKI